jgi:hypothetical protein
MNSVFSDFKETKLTKILRHLIKLLTKILRKMTNDQPNLTTSNVSNKKGEHKKQNRVI